MPVVHRGVPPGGRTFLALRGGPFWHSGATFQGSAVAVEPLNGSHFTMRHIVTAVPSCHAEHTHRDHGNHDDTYPPLHDRLEDFVWGRADSVFARTPARVLESADKALMRRKPTIGTPHGQKFRLRLSTKVGVIHFVAQEGVFVAAANSLLRLHPGALQSPGPRPTCLLPTPSTKGMFDICRAAHGSQRTYCKHEQRRHQRQGRRSIYPHAAYRHPTAVSAS